MSAVPATRSKATRVRHWVRRTGQPVFDGLIREPYREGHLRISHIGPLERQLSVVGLVTLCGLLFSLVVNDLWRRGTLVSLSDVGGRWTFVPLALLALTMVALAVGWVVFMWGALRGSVWTRVAGAVLFLLVNADIGRPSALSIGSSLAIRWGPTLGRVSYFAVPGLLLLYSVANIRGSWGRRARPVFLVLIVAAVVGMFGSLLWIAAAAIKGGLLQNATLTISGNIDSVDVVLQPMLLVSAIAIADFSYTAAQSLTTPVWEVNANLVKALLLVLVGVKLWASHVLGHWLTFVKEDPRALVSAGLGLLFFAGITVLGRHLRRGWATEGQEEKAKERLMYSGILAESLFALTFFFLFSVGDLVLAQTGKNHLGGYINWLSDFVDKHAPFVRTLPWMLMLLLGLFLLIRKGGREVRRELGLGLVLIGGWNLPFYVLSWLNHRVDFTEGLMDVMLTVAIGVGVMVGWRWIDRATAIALSALVVLTWLLFNRGDIIAVSVNAVGRLVGFQSFVAVAVAVFSILWMLIADSEFSLGQGRHLTAESRTLMWVGYLVISTAILNWVQVVHGSDLTGTILENGFSDIAIPLAAWFFIRRPWTPQEAMEAALPSDIGEVEIGLEEGLVPEAGTAAYEMVTEGEAGTFEEALEEERPDAPPEASPAPPPPTGPEPPPQQPER